ncbi:MAG TPA: MMPL family transporter [Alphaproteobacteria bacterium]
MWARFIVDVVERCRRGAIWVAPLLLLVSAGVGVFAAGRLTIDANVANLLSADLPWQQQEAHYENLFPGTVDTLVVVVDGATPEHAETAVTALASRLTAQPDLFQSVQQPGSDPFFRKNGLLFLDLPELSELSEQLIQAQPMIGGLAADPSLRGLFNALQIALLGVRHGDIDPASLSQAITAIGAAINSVITGAEHPMSWSEILTGRTPRPEELRRFIVTKPVLDFSDIQPGARATEAVRTAARELGLTPEHGLRVRITGSVPLNDDELASVEEGAALSISLSVALVVLFLFIALRAVRLIFIVLVTLAAGFACTAAFAAVAVGTLNVISVAFVVMFVGIAVDFAIQFTVRYRAERHRAPDEITALRVTAGRIGAPLSLAATTTALGFLSFTPTDFRGVAELGLIAAGGMVIAAILTFTLLPALLTLVKPSPELAPVGFQWAAPIDRWMVKHRKLMVAVAVCLAAICAASLPWVRFDFNPLHLKDPNRESMATLLDLMNDPTANPYTADVLAPSPDAASALAEKLAALPQVERATNIDSFVPDDQDQKLAIIADLNFFLGPVLNASPARPPPDAAELRQSTSALLEALRDVIAKHGPDGGRGDLEKALAAAAAGDDALWTRLERALIPGITAELAQLRAALSAEHVERATLPPDLVREWVAPDGESRIEVMPRGDVRDNAVLADFRSAVLGVAPQATGLAITVQASADTISQALLVAGVTAAVTISIVLLVALRRIRDAFLVLAPLVLAALLTLATGVVLDLPLNFANVITLPLLLGIGVAFDIYFVTRSREGLSDVLQSAAARAVTFSALTTIGAFGTLALSHHRGTAEMGILLVIALGYALFTTVAFLPPLLAFSSKHPNSRL